MKKRTDIFIIGAGPAGLSAAVNGAARGKSVRLLSVDGTKLSRAESVDNYLGLYHVTGAELMRRFEEHASAMGIRAEKGRVANLLPSGGSFLVNCGGEIAEAGAVVLATGAARARGIPGESAFLGRGVSYCATCDGMLYRGKRAVVWGLSPDAAEEANFLNGIGVSVTLVARGGRPEALDAAVSFQSGAVREIVGDGRVTAAATETETLPADGVFILRSAIAPSAMIDGLGMENGYVKVSRFMETNIPGLFAAGDCTGAPLQVASAVGEGLIAAQQAAKYIDSHPIV